MTVCGFTLNTVKAITNTKAAGGWAYQVDAVIGYPYILILLWCNYCILLRMKWSGCPICRLLQGNYREADGETCQFWNALLWRLYWLTL